MPIYVDTLGRLDDINMTYDTLDNLTDFFISPFQRKEIPKPGLGPTAFGQFFDQVFAYAYPTTKTCPKPIRQYLIIHAGATGQNFTDDFPSSDTHMEVSLHTFILGITLKLPSFDRPTLILHRCRPMPRPRRSLCQLP
jgi:hypothetical protein